MAGKKKILIIFGTRPEAIKLIPVVNAINKSNSMEGIVCVTAQHREMLDQVLNIFSIKPDIDLNIMKPNQDIFSLTHDVLKKMKSVLASVKPDMVIIQGDTTTAMASALAAFYAKVAVGHVEAGLRTHNKYAPFPEEINRRLASVLADYHFAPTKLAKSHLLKENITKDKIFVTGNTVVDALLEVSKKINKGSFNKKIRQKFDFLDKNRRLVLITGHRRENFGETFKGICHAFKEMAEEFTDMDFVYPVHLNPNVQKPVKDILERANLPNFYLIEPLDYAPFIYIMNRSCLIITDSGGIQEEAPSLNKPVIVTRDVTERPEGIETGLIHLVGNKREDIVMKAKSLLLSKCNGNVKKGNNYNPYGDGKAALRIVRILKKILLQNNSTSV